MIINDEGYIINQRRHGEKSLILTILTKDHGKMVGYVKNCLNKKNLGIYQLGNQIRVEAYARVEDNMWNFHIELIQAHAANFIMNSKKLAVLSSFCALCNDAMPESQNLEDLYQCIEKFFNLINEENWLTYYCYFEFYLMSFLGISLDLEKCAVTGCSDNLKYVSPRSGKAVCAEVGFPYRRQLYAYPQFILDNNEHPQPREMKNLLEMTGFFLHKNFFKTHYLKFPTNRANLLESLDLE